jgi:hypothetical protein
MACLFRPPRGLTLTFAMAAALAVTACGGSPAPDGGQPAGQSKPDAAAPPQAPAPQTQAAQPPAAQPALPQAPPPKGGEPVNADARALATFEARLKDYVQLHKKLEDNLPKLKKDSTPLQIDKHQRTLEQLLHDARKGAKPGDIFTPDAQVVIKALMAKVFGGPDGKALRDSIMDENPGPMKLSANSRYPDTVPLSTVPPQVLQGLPKLDEEMEYRFIGYDLILMDVHAHLIADLVPNALPH